MAPQSKGYWCCCCLWLVSPCCCRDQDNFLQTVASDWRYERALQGIRLLAQHHVGQLVQSLIAWRQAVNEDIKKNFSSNNIVNVQGVCKRVSIGSTCLPTQLQVQSMGLVRPAFGTAFSCCSSSLRFHDAVFLCTLDTLPASQCHCSCGRSCHHQPVQRKNSCGCATQAAMEILFLEAAMQVLGEFVPEFWQDQHFQSFFKSMLQ